MKKRLFFDKTVDFESMKLFIVINDGKVREYHGFDLASGFISAIIPNPQKAETDLDYKVFDMNADFKIEKVSKYDRKKNQIKANYKVECWELNEKTLKDVYIRFNFLEKFLYDYNKKQTILHEMKFKQKVLYFFLFSIPALFIGYFINNSGIKFHKQPKIHEISNNIVRIENKDFLIEKIKTPSVLFFKPNSTEFDSISKVDKSGGIDEVSSDFEYYAKEIIDLYKDSTLSVSYTDKRFFLIKNKLIDKNNQDFPFGIIFTKDNLYKIKTGVYSSIDTEQLINEFFKK